MRLYRQIFIGFVRTRWNGNGGKATLRFIRHGAPGRAALVGFGARAEHCVRDVPGKIRIGKARARKYLRKISDLLGRRRTVPVEQTAVDRRHGTYIVGSLPSPFYFQRRNVRVDKLGDMPRKAVILQR